MSNPVFELFVDILLSCLADLIGLGYVMVHRIVLERQANPSQTTTSHHTS